MLHLKGLCHNHTISYHMMLLCILIHMDAMIILYSTQSVHIISVPLTHLTQKIAQGFDLWECF